MKVSICHMSEKDLSAVLAIEKECFSRPWTEEMFLFELERNRVSLTYVARLNENSKTCGYICIWFLPGEAQIINVAVHPEYQGRGIGKKLLDFAIDKIVSKKVKEVFLEVRVSNATAIHLYEKAGFIQIGKRRKYYSDTGEDAFIMKKDLLIS